MEAVIVMLRFLHPGVACGPIQDSTDVAQQYTAAGWRVWKRVRSTQSNGLQEELAGNFLKSKHLYSILYSTHSVFLG